MSNVKPSIVLVTDGEAFGGATWSLSDGLATRVKQPSRTDPRRNLSLWCSQLQYMHDNLSKVLLR